MTGRIIPRTKTEREAYATAWEAGFAAGMRTAGKWTAPAQGIEAGTDETLQAAQPEGQEPGRDSDAPNPSQNPSNRSGDKE